jgi:hypothetical protein
VSCHSPDPKTKIGSEIPAWGNSELRRRVLHLDPLEIVDERKRRLSGCARCDQIRQELHADSFLGVRAPV